jgi:CopG family nickel-responsive transcriptional regulator
MKEELVRFGVAFEASLLRQLDALAKARGCTRSELLRDIARAEVGQSRVESGVPAVAALTLVYDHHMRGLGDKLTELQHELGDGVRANMHVHLDRDLCLEVVVLQGRSDQLAAIADRTLAIRGVKHGGIEIVTQDEGRSRHDHDHPHPHPHAPARAPRRR